MADITWIKIRTNMFDDEKIKLIERMPEGDGILITWVKLLAYAGKVNCNGYIMINENIPMNVEQVAIIFNRPFEKVKYAISVLQGFGMLEVTEDEVIAITNWEKHQNVEGMDKIRAQNRERKRLERERKKSLLLENNKEQPCHVTVTGSHATDIEKEIDKEKDIKTLPQQVEGPSNKQLEEQFDQWYSFYPKKVNKKKAFDKFKLKVKKHGFEKVFEGMTSYAKVMELNGTDKQYIKGPDVFLNGEHYLDDQSELLKQKQFNQQQSYKPWEELAYGTETNSSNYDDYSKQLPNTTKQIGW